MSRHRNIRSMNYSDEYDGYDDVYGHSMEDDNSVSPNAKQFIYDQNKQAIMRSFLINVDSEKDNKVVKDEARLKSCRDAIRNLLTDALSESELNRIIIELNYNTEAVIDLILNPPKQATGSEPSSGSKSKNYFSDYSNISNSSKIDINFDKKSNMEKSYKINEIQTFSSLSDMITKTSNLSEDKTSIDFSYSSPPDLSAYYLKTFEKKQNSPSGFIIPKMTFNTSKSTHIDSNNSSSFNCLSDLTAYHLNISTKNKNDSRKSVGSSPFIIPKISFKKTASNDTLFFDSLASFTPHHLKICDDDVNNIEKNIGLPSEPKIESIKNVELINMPSSSFDTLTTHHLKTKISTTSHLIAPKFSKKVKQESGTNDNIQDIPTSDITNFSNLTFEENRDSNKIIKSQTEVLKLHNEMFLKRDNSENIIYKNQSNNLLELTKQAIKKEYVLNCINCNNSKLLKKPVSPFGKVLCKKYKRKIIYTRKEMTKLTEEFKTVLRFDFSSPSPDSKKLEELKRIVKKFIL